VTDNIETEDLAVSKFDAADYLERESSRVALINDAIASGSPTYIANAIGAVARAGGLSALARATGIKRQTLNKSFGKQGNPTLATLLPVLEKLGLELRVQPRDRQEKAAA
jgi:probable addiction module antidote protein